jgi:hypothetical protein
VVAEKGLTGSMAAALAARNIVGPDAEALIADVLQMYQLVKKGCGPPAAVVCGAGGEATQQAAAAAAAVPLLRWDGKGRQAGTQPLGGIRGRSLPRDTPMPREGSSSRSPRGTWEDEY